jgi:hypothetical protein
VSRGVCATGRRGRAVRVERDMDSVRGVCVRGVCVRGVRVERLLSVAGVAIGIIQKDGLADRPWVQ